MSGISRLKAVMAEEGLAIDDPRLAKYLDANDSLAELGNNFQVPSMKQMFGTDLSLVNGSDRCIYMVGNSLGLPTIKAKQLTMEMMDSWANYGVHGHLHAPMPFATGDEMCVAEMSKVVGAKINEVALMNALTVNIHLLMVSFYKPTRTRNKVLIEAHAFPSDHYAIESQIRMHGLDPQECMICIKARDGEETLREEDVFAAIAEEGEHIAVVWLPGVQYYTGQLFDMASITAAAQQRGCLVGWDLAHAVGNVPLKLHDWNVDFAVWCTYKYLNGSAGGIGGAFVNERHTNDKQHMLTGWWSHKMDTRFRMDNVMEQTPGALGYRISNPPALLLPSLYSSLRVFAQTDMSDIRAKSVLLTTYAHALLMHHFGEHSAHRQTAAFCRLITPSTDEARGAQLSVAFSIDIDDVYAQLTRRGVVCDLRRPSVIRIAPVPLYNTFDDIYRMTITLKQILQ